MMMNSLLVHRLETPQPQDPRTRKMECSRHASRVTSRPTGKQMLKSDYNQ
jgi:hypothetical protein